MDIKWPWDTLKGITRPGVSNSPHMPQSTKERLNALHFHSQTQRSHLHSWPKDSQLHHPPLQQQVIVTPHTNLFSCYNPTQNHVLKTTTFPRVLLKHVSQAQLRSQAPAWERSKGVKGDTGIKACESYWKRQGGAFQSSFCHPRIGPTRQRN